MRQDNIWAYPSNVGADHPLNGGDHAGVTHSRLQCLRSYQPKVQPFEVMLIRFDGAHSETPAVQRFMPDWLVEEFVPAAL